MLSSDLPAAIEEAKARQAKEAAEDNARQLKAYVDPAEKIRERERRAREKQRFLSVDLSFHDMFRQSDARVYFMKTHQAEYSHPNMETWEFPKVANKLLSRFKYNKKHAEQYEQMVQAAIRIGTKSQVDEYKAEADRYLTKCLYAHYGIGVLYRQFLEGRLDAD